MATMARSISCIAFSYVLSWPIFTSIHVFTGSFDKHNVNFKVSSICFNVDKKHWGGRGSSVIKSEKLTKLSGVSKNVYKINQA